MKKFSIIHLYLYGRIRKETVGKVVHKSQINPILKWVVRVPHKYQAEIIQELIDAGLITRLCRDTYRINDSKIHPLSDSLGDPLW